MAVGNRRTGVSVLALSLTDSRFREVVQAPVSSSFGDRWLARRAVAWALGEEKVPNLTHVAIRAKIREAAK